MKRRLWLLTLFAMPGLPHANDGLAFKCSSQTIPGQDLAVQVERQPERDPATSMPRSGATSAPLGDVRVAVYRCKPRGALFKPVFQLRPRRDFGDGRVAGSDWFKPSDVTKVERRLRSQPEEDRAGSPIESELASGIG